MTISASIRESATGLNLMGTVNVDVVVSPSPVRVEYYLDNVLMSNDLSAPYTWTWDTTKEADGTHIVRAEAVYKSRRSRAQITVTTKNSVSSSAGTFGVATFGGQGFAVRFRRRVAEFFGFASNNR